LPPIQGFPAVINATLNWVVQVDPWAMLSHALLRDAIVDELNEILTVPVRKR
jgi:hypothetical protein